MRYAIIILVILTVPALAHAATLKVPSQYPNIQDAIDAAVNGDTVLVAPGTYVENINFKGKAITVVSRDGPGMTAINAQMMGSVVTFDYGEGPDSVLDGFTITKGKGTGDYIFGYKGGGVYCYYTSPTIQNNIIHKNGSWSFSDCHGGGLYLKSSSALIKDNIISNNGMGSWDFSSYGGGIYIEEGSPTISGNLIELNYVIGKEEEFTAAAAGGGGIYTEESEVFITNNIIRHNSAKAYWASGGGIKIHTWKSLNEALVANNIIHSNKVEGYSAYGGGICCNSKIKILNNNIFSNTVTGEDYTGPGSPWPPIFIEGGGICCRDNYSNLHSARLRGRFFDFNVLITKSPLTSCITCTEWISPPQAPLEFAFLAYQWREVVSYPP